MKYATVSIQVPEMMENFVSFSNPNDLLIRNALIFYPRIKNLEISHGRAAELLGISKW